jgi:hypothetical protein
MMYAAIAMRAAAGQKEPPNEGMTTDIETEPHLSTDRSGGFVRSQRTIKAVGLLIG